jgi:hypothetical protein
MIYNLVTIQLLLLLNSFVCIGFFYSSQEGMILGFIDYIGLPDWLKMPLNGCPTCMASLHSTYVFIPALLLLNWSWFIYPIYILALAGMNTYLYNHIESLK